MQSFVTQVFALDHFFCKICKLLSIAIIRRLLQVGDPLQFAEAKFSNYCSRSFCARFAKGHTKLYFMKNDTLRLPDKYSSPRLVVDRMEELIVGLLLVKNVWCQKQSWSFMNLLCSGMVGFGLRRNLGTTEKEHPSPTLHPPMLGEVLALFISESERNHLLAV